MLDSLCMYVYIYIVCKIYEIHDVHVCIRVLPCLTYLKLEISTVLKCVWVQRRGLCCANGPQRHQFVGRSKAVLFCALGRWCLMFPACPPRVTIGWSDIE